MAAHYRLRKNAGQYHFVLKAGNNETILTSETYASKQGASSGIASCRVNSPIDARYQRLNARDGSPYFVLRANNNEPIGASETYSSTQARDQGIESCKVNGPTTQVVDETGE
jgi:uncharacterized protein YegP (UPF0339 family)